VRLHEADHDRARLKLLNLLDREGLHREEHIAAGEHLAGGAPADTLI
jgi:hypothetical protein